jgi:hypothetical protein
VSDRRNAVEVFSQVAGSGYAMGSGYHLGGGLVLTAAHLLPDDDAAALSLDPPI